MSVEPVVRVFTFVLRRTTTPATHACVEIDLGPRRAPRSPDRAAVSARSSNVGLMAGSSAPSLLALAIGYAIMWTAVCLYHRGRKSDEDTKKNLYEICMALHNSLEYKEKNEHLLRLHTAHLELRVTRRAAPRHAPRLDRAPGETPESVPHRAPVAGAGQRKTTARTPVRRTPPPA